MNRPAVGAALALSFLAAPRLAAACAGCRNPNLPTARTAAAQLTPGEVRASVMLSATYLHVVHEAGCADPAACAEIPVQPPHMHDQQLYPGELRAIAEVGITPRLSVEIHLPLRLTATTIAYTTPEGAPYAPRDPDLHHRNETLFGFGDPWLLARAGLAAAGWWVQGRAGTSVAVGRTEPDPFRLGAMGTRHQHIQFGSGTLDPIAALDVARRVGRLSLSGYVQGQVSLYENEHGFRAGARFLGGVQAGTELFEKLTGALGVDILHDGAERWDGRILQEGMLGRTELLAGVSVTRQWQHTSLSVLVRVPVYRHLIRGDEPPGRLSSPLALSLTVSRSFGAGG